VCRYWGFRRVIDALTGESDLKMLSLGPYYEVRMQLSLVCAVADFRA
jgi:hypothetical protein